MKYHLLREEFNSWARSQGWKQIKSYKIVDVCYEVWLCPSGWVNDIKYTDDGFVQEVVTVSRRS